MSANNRVPAERRATERMRQALAQQQQQQTATIIAVTVGVVVGVAVATGLTVWVLTRARKAVLVTDDPEAPLFV